MDTTEVEALLTRLYRSGVPDSGMSVGRRARQWSQIAAITGQASEIASALARRLASEGDGGR
ncbi:hypothetical protein KGQ19_46525 [Catenulispora sp. NL8]|uniref:Uncharacterized protein n=1 Tax=Catenulispora pinistramenti TaxID=2705254 RepID=A0ABS5L7J1_9ACTN|nr:hypothetical protein [Catenulispora pinistramenti]MBS2554336.1 hypothetical protein [Catenulispora pinistramenti]